MTDPVVREFLLGFWKIHILHHAEDQGVFGHWMLEELQRHGYRLSPGTLYPLLARMARRGWLRATEPKRLRASLAELQHEVGPRSGGGSRASAGGANLRKAGSPRALRR